MKKISAIVTGLAIAGILTVSLNTFTQQAMNRGDGGAPARPDYINIGDGGGAPSNAHGNTGIVVAQEI
ncbi:Phr family secreted Rap phosphatase inhibitor [Bacillus pseudomycoides]|uniref:Phr family secreted Rap phosphatase inhibitor n=1 Tax=Bacillus pseudomycoides TaxID=64104 RepID=UPI000BEE1F12|nr:Phr family secreted Rap phosphatase inhibitor [Bacillus pseudomycoides]PDZ74055.1 Phr family secreted Rap phosphatase inhibitor [Bacillus pseudomycoides]